MKTPVNPPWNPPLRLVATSARRPARAAVTPFDVTLSHDQRGKSLVHPRIARVIALPICACHTLADLVPSRFVRVNAQGKTRSSELAYQQAQKGNERRAWLFMYEGTNRTKWFRSFTPPHNLLNLRCTKQCYPDGFQVHLIHIAMQVMISRGSWCSAE